MVKLIKKNHKTQEIMRELSVTNNWWDVYLETARMQGRRIVWHSNNSYSVIFTEKNMVYTLAR